MKKTIAIVFSFITALYVNANECPKGQNTAEGVAADLAKAFIHADNGLWEKIQFSRFQTKKEYKKFIDAISKQMDSLKNQKNKRGPKEILEIRKMGKLSKNGPNSYAYATFNIPEIGYVDVCVLDYDDQKRWNRTFVLKSEKKWYVLTRPDLFPLLSMGLNNEKEIKEIAYKK